VEDVIQFRQALELNGKKVVLGLAEGILAQLVFDCDSEGMNGILLTLIDLGIVVGRCPNAVIKADAAEDETVKDEGVICNAFGLNPLKGVL